MLDFFYILYCRSVIYVVVCVFWQCNFYAEVLHVLHASSGNFKMLHWLLGCVIVPPTQFIILTYLCKCSHRYNMKCHDDVGGIDNQSPPSPSLSLFLSNAHNLKKDRNDFQIKMKKFKDNSNQPNPLLNEMNLKKKYANASFHKEKNKLYLLQ